MVECEEKGAVCVKKWQRCRIGVPPRGGGVGLGVVRVGGRSIPNDRKQDKKTGIAIGRSETLLIGSMRRSFGSNGWGAIPFEEMVMGTRADEALPPSL
jgi:hypothetical protein